MKITRLISTVAMLLVVLSFGCKKDDDAGVRPMVTSTDPLSKAIGVPIDSKIGATFSVAMNHSTISTTTFKLQNGSLPVAGAVTFNDTTAIFTPEAKLIPNTVYTATITTDTKSKAGVSLAKDYNWTFTTNSSSDISNPTVISTEPINGAQAVTLDHLIIITFSESMDPATITALSITLKQGANVITGAVTSNNNKATFNPTSDLAPNTVYTATISTLVKDLEGNAMSSIHAFTFTTGDAPDTILPMVESTTPLDNATNIPLNGLISLTFSEAMDPLTINASTFTLTQEGTPVAGTVAYSGTPANLSPATFTPTNSLKAGTKYTAIITTGAKDIAGNTLAANTTWTFTTAQASTIIATDPAINATGVLLNKTVTASFSGAMDPATITAATFILKQGATPIAGTVSYNGTTASFNPTNDLSSNTTYTATITTNAKNTLGAPLASDYTWSFTTLTVTPNLATVDLGAAGNYVILAKTAINNTPTSAITGNLGLSPAATSFITGFALTNSTGYATSPQVTGKLYAADMADPTPINLTTAVNNMITAYNDAAGRPSPDFFELGTGNIGGRTLAPGLYKWTNTVTLPSDVTISGGANDIWIFQIAGNLTISSAVNVTLVGGAQAKNIFWQVAGEASFGTTSHFEGIILSKTSVTFQTGASINGRALAQTAVILDGNAVTMP